MQLRNYQQKIKSDIRYAFKKGVKAPLVVLPTGSGKTVIASDLCKSTNEKGYKTAFIAHRQELLIQTSLTMAMMGIQHKFVASKSIEIYARKLHQQKFGKVFIDPMAKTNIVSVNTLAGRIKNHKYVDDFHFLIFDEAHHVVAGQWQTVIDHYKYAFILGLTATPERLDGKGLGTESGGCFDDLIVGLTVQELIDQGNLTPPKILAPPVQLELDGIRTLRGDYNLKDVEDKLEKASITGDVIEHYKRHALGVPTVAFCPSVKYAQTLADDFRLAGISSVSIDGKMNDEDRRDAIEGLGSSKYHVLTSCDIVSEGTDIPIIGAAILLRPTKSLALYMQQVGRALRPYPGKEYSLILDHVGNCFRHGSPVEAREWTLEGRKKTKPKKIDPFLKDLNLRNCQECYTIYEARLKSCPGCGASYKPKERKDIDVVDGNLSEITEETIKALKLQRKREEGSARTVDELVAVGKSRGYKHPYQWASHRFKARRSKNYA